MVTLQAVYPTTQHEQAAKRIVEIFADQPDVQAVLLTCSCARGKATRDSCLDIAVLIKPEALAVNRPGLEQKWKSSSQLEPAFQALQTAGKYAFVDLEFVDGLFEPGYHGWTSGPDEFELAIGNLLVYSVPLWEQGDTLQQLKNRWLPYYTEELRQERLEMVRRYCLNNLDHIPGFIERGLYFQSFQRLWHAFGEFLQALFISRRVYPIAYDKWIREQIEEILELPQLYPALPRLFEIRHFESDEITRKAKILENLLAEFIPDDKTKLL